MPNHIHMIVYFKELGGHGNPPLRDIIRDLNHLQLINLVGCFGNALITTTSYAISKTMKMRGIT